MSEKDTIIRQRLIELERKHAKALKKLQRAERSKQRRQTFHGFTVKDENTNCNDVQNRSSILLSNEALSPDDSKSSSLSAHKKGLGKSVTFKDTVDTTQLPPSNKRCCENEENNGFKEKSRRSSLMGSCILETEPEADVKVFQSRIESTNNKYVAADKNKATLSSDSLLLSDNEKVHAVDVINEKHKDCSKTLDDEDCIANNVETEGSFGLGKDVPITSIWHKEHNDSEEVSFDNNKTELSGKEMEIPAIDTVVELDRVSSDQNSEKVSTSEKICTQEGVDESSPKGNYILENEEHSSVPKSDHSPLENWQWLQLFEEEFPRRSPRLRSTPNFGSQNFSQDNSHDVNSKKTKPTRTKQPRAKKESILHSGDKLTKCKKVEPILCTNLDEEISKGFTFPKPTSELMKNGGSLSVVVDFSLPDKDFAKLKLAKIKGALPVERIRDVANEESKKTNLEHTRSDMMNSRDNMLFESKREEDVKEACFHPSYTSACSVLACSAQEGGSDSAENTEANRTDEEQALSTSVNLECNKQSDCTVNDSPFNFECQQFDLKSQNEPEKCCDDTFSFRQQSQEAIQKGSTCQGDAGPSHHNSSYVEISSVPEVIGVQQNGDSKTKHEHEQHILCEEHDKLVNKIVSAEIDQRLDNNVLLQCGSAGQQNATEFSNDRDSHHECPETVTDDLHQTCDTSLPLEANNLDIQTSPEQINYDQGESNLTAGKSGLSYPEPSIGDQATPHGKMREPLESSQLSCMTLPEDRSEHSPLLRTACLQHHIEGEDNKVRSVSLSSYEPSAEEDVGLLEKKRDILAVCLAHLIVIWTVIPGIQWTVLHKWNLPTDGEEEFLSVQIVPLSSHIVLLVGGNFCGSNGRILGYSEQGDYSFNLEPVDKINRHVFSAMCLLRDTLYNNTDEDVEVVIGSQTDHKVELTKWTLDSSCLLVEQQQSFPSVITDGDLSSLHAVHGSHCLLLGTTEDTLFLWNHKTCQQLRSISLETVGLGHLSCLEAFTKRGLLFLIMASKSEEGVDCGEYHPSTDACLLFALNPKTSKLICLECFSFEERMSTVNTNGQFIASGQHGTGKVNIWNIASSQNHASLQVFQDEVSSIGFHQDKPVIAFGNTGGCVHLLSVLT